MTYTTLQLGNFATGGAIGNTEYLYTPTNIIVNQTTAGQTLTIVDFPGQIMMSNNGTVPYFFAEQSIAPNNFTKFSNNGNGWKSDNTANEIKTNLTNAQLIGAQTALTQGAFLNQLALDENGKIFAWNGTTWNLKTNIPQKYVKVPIVKYLNTMAAGSVFPTFGASSTDFSILPTSQRFSVEPLNGNYKPIEIQARLVNSTATPITFDFTINGTVIPAINIVYSATLVSYPIPTINQIPTTIAKTQLGISSNSLNKALEAYIIYELI